jgi:sugar phosphate isomerase/epimerase
MTVSAADTARLVREVGHPNVGVLYDQANLVFTHQEAAEEALALQRGHIVYVHVKDLVFVDRDTPFRAAAVATVEAPERSVRSRIVGQGEMDWFSILRGLREQGYDGWLSLEYERRWHPQDLPPADSGMREGAECIRTLLARLEG